MPERIYLSPPHFGEAKGASVREAFVGGGGDPALALLLAPSARERGATGAYLAPSE